jgi:hypothetical protein
MILPSSISGTFEAANNEGIKARLENNKESFMVI